MSIPRRCIVALALVVVCTTTDTSAVATATQRVREHGNAGLSIDDVKRTRDWFTPEMYALLVADMSHPTDIGYVGFDPTFSTCVIDRVTVISRLRSDSTRKQSPSIGSWTTSA